MSKLLREHDELIAAALKAAKELGVYLVLRINKSSAYRLSWRNSAVDDLLNSASEGVGLYTFTDTGHVAFGATNSMTVAAIVKLVEDTAAVAKANQAAGSDAAKEIFELPYQENLGEDKLHYQVYEAADIRQRDVVDYVATMEKYIHSLEQSAKLSFTFVFEQEQWRIVRSDGTDIDFSIPYARAIFDITIRDKDRTTIGYVRLYKPSYQNLLSDIDGTKGYLKSEVTLAKEQLHAEPIDPGSFPTLVGGDLAGTLVHEALGHPAESDAVAENGSVLGDKANKFRRGAKVAAGGVTVVDHEEGLNHGFHPYGAFGNKREAVTIIEDGILKESLSDIFTAQKTGVVNKNTERSEHYQVVAIPRMSTTYIKLSKEKLLAEDLPSAEPHAVQEFLKQNNVFKKYPKIYYLMGFRGGSVAMKTGDFMFGSGYTYELTQDSVTVKRPVSFSGNVLEALKSIEFGVGKLQTDDFGYCGKSSQRVYVSDGGHELIFFGPTKHVSIA